MASSSSVHQTAQMGFSKPDSYEKIRPTYQSEPVNHMISLLKKTTDPLTVVDLAAGTGKLTRCLLPHFELPSKLIAIEPVQGMREVFSKVLPGVDILDGAADSMPIENESVDGLFIGQAFHWFANEASLKEFHRILKPGAPVAMIWNMADEDSSQRAHQIWTEYEKYNPGCPQYREGTWQNIWNEPWALENFTALNSQEWKWEMMISKDFIWEYVASISFIAALEAEEFNKLQEKIRNITKDLPDEGLLYPHATEVAWAFKK